MTKTTDLSHMTELGWKNATNEAIARICVRVGLAPFEVTDEHWMIYQDVEPVNAAVMIGMFRAQEQGMNMVINMVRQQASRA